MSGKNAKKRPAEDANGSDENVASKPRLSEPTPDITGRDGGGVRSNDRTTDDLVKSTHANSIGIMQKIDDKLVSSVNKAHARIDVVKEGCSKLQARLEKLEGKIDMLKEQCGDATDDISDYWFTLQEWKLDIEDLRSDLIFRYDEFYILCL